MNTHEEIIIKNTAEQEFHYREWDKPSNNDSRPDLSSTGRDSNSLLRPGASANKGPSLPTDFSVLMNKRSPRNSPEKRVIVKDGDGKDGKNIFSNDWETGSNAKSIVPGRGSCGGNTTIAPQREKNCNVSSIAPLLSQGGIKHRGSCGNTTIALQGEKSSNVSSIAPNNQVSSDIKTKSESPKSKSGINNKRKISDSKKSDRKKQSILPIISSGEDSDDELHSKKKQKFNDDNKGHIFTRFKQALQNFQKLMDG